MLTAAILVLVILSVAYYIYCGSYITWFRTSRKNRVIASNTGVSLMIPVCGVDEEAYENWISFLKQDHENYEVLFGVMDRNDPAVSILRELVDQFQRGLIKSKANRVEVHFCPTALGANHQISNLIHLFRIARYEQIVLADSDIRTTPDYLCRFTAPLGNPEVGVVTCGYIDRTPRSLGAALASFGRCIDFIPGVLIARKLDGGLKFAIGPTIATRKSVLLAIGGLEVLLNRIGSDYHIGKKAADCAYRVVLSDYVLQNSCGRESVRHVFLRELRWARTIRLNRGGQYYGMALCYGTVYALFPLVFSGFQNWAVTVFLVTISIRFLQVLISIWALNAPKLLLWIWTLPLRDLMSFVVWLGGCFGRSVYWRGRRLQIGVNGVLTEQRPF